VQKVLHDAKPSLPMIIGTGHGPPRQVPKLALIVEYLDSADVAMRSEAWRLLLTLPEYVASPLRDASQYLDQKYAREVRMGALLLSLRGAGPHYLEKGPQAYDEAMHKRWSGVLSRALADDVAPPYLPEVIAELAWRTIPAARIIEIQQQRLVVRSALLSLTVGHLSDAQIAAIARVAVSLDGAPGEIAAWFKAVPSPRARRAILNALVDLEWSQERVRASFEPVVTRALQDWNADNQQLAKHILEAMPAASQPAER
jgi:hypothetical protein